VIGKIGLSKKVTPTNKVERISLLILILILMKGTQLRKIFQERDLVMDSKLSMKN
jgi:hypothetical protein